MVGIKRGARQPSAKSERYGTLGGQRQNLEFLEDYSSDDSFARMGYQLPKAPKSTLFSRAVKTQPKSRDYGTFPGRDYIKLQQEQQPKNSIPDRAYAPQNHRVHKRAQADDTTLAHLVWDGRVYAFLFAATWIVMSPLTSVSTNSRIVISFGMNLLAFAINSALAAIWYKRVPARGKHALERGGGEEPTENIPGTPLVPIWVQNRSADLFKAETYITYPMEPMESAAPGKPDDDDSSSSSSSSFPSFSSTSDFSIEPYDNHLPSEYQVRRTWEEALVDYGPHFYRGMSNIASKIGYLALQLTALHCLSQLGATVAQSLGGHYHDGVDVIGFFPRYWVNLTSLENLFGMAGAAELRGYVRSTLGWFCGWVYGPITLCTRGF